MQMDISHHAHHLPERIGRRRVIGHTDAHALAHGVFTGPEALRRLSFTMMTRRAQDIRLQKTAPRLQAHAHRVEAAGRDHIDLGRWPFRCLGRKLFRSSARGGQTPAVGQHVQALCGGHARLAAQILQQLFLEGLAGFHRKR